MTGALHSGIPLAPILRVFELVEEYKVTRGNFDHGVIPITAVNNESVAQ